MKVKVGKYSTLKLLYIETSLKARECTRPSYIEMSVNVRKCSIIDSYRSYG